MGFQTSIVIMLAAGCINPQDVLVKNSHKPEFVD